MKIEITPKEIAELVTELQARLVEWNFKFEIDDKNAELTKELKTRLENIKSDNKHDTMLYICDNTKNKKCAYFGKCPSVCNRTTIHKEFALLDDCGNPFKSHSLIRLEDCNL